MTSDQSVDSWLRSYVQEAELDKVCHNFDVWTIEESPAALNTLTHGFFRYFGKFPSPVATRFIKEYHDPTVGPVVDPMVGSGTTLVEAILLHRAAIGIDVNPLSALIAKVKTTPLSLETVERTVENLAKFQPDPDPSRYSRYIPQDKYLDHWFYKETQEQIAGTRWFIDNQIEDQDVKDLFTVALGASIRRLSRASNGLGRMFLDPAKTHQDVYEMVGRQIMKALPRLRELALLNPDVRVLNQDAQKPFLHKDFTNFVIIHPPYFNLYKYSGIYKFEMLWLGYDITGAREGEITEGFKSGRKELVHAYARDMGEIFHNIYDILVPGGVAVLMIGDTVLKGERINTTYLTIKEIVKSSFRVEQVIVRPPKFTEASYAAAQRRGREQVGVKLADYLIVLRKS